MQFRVTSGGDYDAASSQDIVTESGELMSACHDADGRPVSLIAGLGWNPYLETELSFHIQHQPAYFPGGILIIAGSGLYIDWRDESGVLTAVGLSRGDEFLGGSNADSLNGGQGNDKLVGNAGNDTLGGSWGDDILVGGLGRDRMFGGFDNDDLQGGEGNDDLRGNAGDDILSGQAGRDFLKGREGQDTFVFADGFGKDTIDDFKSGEDKIDLSGLSGFDDILDVHAHATEHQGFLSIEGGFGTLILRNVQMADLVASDFIF